MVDGAVRQHRYYLETDEGNYYLMVTSEMEVTTLHADDLVIGSIRERRCRFSFRT